MYKLLILFCVCCVMCGTSHNNTKYKLIIDNDAGVDDAMAISLAHLLEKYFNGPQLVALTTANGNTNEDNVSLNNQRILRVIKRQDIPIYRGSKKSIVITAKSDNYFGKDGLGDVEDDDTTPLVLPQRQGAVESLIELSKKYEDELVIVAIGPVTNIALALKIDPGFLSRLAHLYIGGGHINSTKNPNPEFNAHMDVEAYHIIAQEANPDKVTVLPYSQIQIFLDLSRDWREKVLGAIDTYLMKALNKYEKKSLLKTDRWWSLDPAVVAMLVNPDLVQEYKYSRNDIIMCGDERGITTNTFVGKDDANVKVIYAMKQEEYKKFLINAFSAELSTGFGTHL